MLCTRGRLNRSLSFSVPSCLVQKLIWLDTSQFQNSVSQFRLFKRLVSFSKTALVVSDSLALREDVAVRPVCRSFVLVEELYLLSQVLWRCKFGRRVCSIDQGANDIALRQASVVDCTRVPDDDVAWFRIDLDEFAAIVLEPFHLFSSISEPIELAWIAVGLWLRRILDEEPLKQLRTALKQL